MFSLLGIFLGDQTVDGIHNGLWDNALLGHQFKSAQVSCDLMLRLSGGILVPLHELLALIFLMLLIILIQVKGATMY